MELHPANTPSFLPTPSPHTGPVRYSSTTTPPTASSSIIPSVTSPGQSISSFQQAQSSRNSTPAISKAPIIPANPSTKNYSGSQQHASSSKENNNRIPNISVSTSPAPPNQSHSSSIATPDPKRSSQNSQVASIKTEPQNSKDTSLAASRERRPRRSSKKQDSLPSSPLLPAQEFSGEESKSIVTEGSRPQRNASRKKKKSLYCICESPEDGKFMVACDICDNWFHPKCVQLSNPEAKALDYFICQFCVDHVPQDQLLEIFPEYDEIQERKKRRLLDNASDASSSAAASPLLTLDHHNMDILLQEATHSSGLMQFDFLQQLAEAADQELSSSNTSPNTSPGKSNPPPTNTTNEDVKPITATAPTIPIEQPAKTTTGDISLVSSS